MNNGNTFGGIDEILRYLGYEKDDSCNSNNDNSNPSSNQSCSDSQCTNEKINDDGTIEKICERYGIKYKCTIDPSGGANSNCCKNFNSDIIGGFQDIDPNSFIILAEVIGDLLSGGLPFNVATAVSNWFNLVGQIIETYASQLVYFQSGPGRFYKVEDRNVANPFCSSSKVTEDETSSNNTYNSENTSTNSADGNNDSENKSCNTTDDSSYNNLKETVERISSELEDIKNQFDKLNNKIEMLKINSESLKK